MNKEVNESKNKEIVKKRILLLLKYFYENTDEYHQVDTFQLLEYFKDKKTLANRKTLKNDIDTLIDAGYDIVIVSSKPNRYFLGDRGFELPELKLLVDAVSSSRFITQKKSDVLIQKLSSMASVSQQEELKRNVYPSSRAKSTNESSFYVVDKMKQSINIRRLPLNTSNTILIRRKFSAIRGSSTS